jgi:tetratricopeptide (TPR) repeat protein
VTGSAASRDLARGALATAALTHAGHLALLAGWSGGPRGRATLFLGILVAVAAAIGVARIARRLVASRAVAFGASALGLAGFALLARVPAGLHPIGIDWIDAALVLLLPTVPIVASIERRPTSIALAAFGGIAALVVDERLLLPRVGFAATLIAWAIVWGLAERSDHEAEDEGRAAARGAEAIGLVIACGLAGFLVAFERPFLTQHLPPDRAGAHVIALAMLASCAVGFLSASVLARSERSPWSAWIGTAILLLGSWMSWRALTVVSWERWPAWLTSLHTSGTSLAKTSVAVWLFLALPLFGFGFALRGLSRGEVRACAFAWAGLWAGTLAAERFALPALGEGGAWEAAARARLCHPPLIGVRSYAMHLDGVATRHAARSPEPIDVCDWQTVPWSRPKTWGRLDACELPPAGVVCIGFLQPDAARAMDSADASSIRFLDPLPTPGARDASGRNPCAELFAGKLAGRGAVLLAHAAPVSSLTLAETATGLERLARDVGPDGSLRVWCDPRGLSVEGLRTTLATWRAELPRRRVRVLLDGYAGPLIGIETREAVPASAEVEALTFASLDAAALQVEGAGIASTDRPLLLWQGAHDPPAFDLADAGVLRELARDLALPPSGAAGLILEGLARHAEAHEVREVAASSYDRIRIPDGEIAAYREALAAGDEFAPGLRHVATVADILYHKRDFDVLVGLMRDAIAAHPGEGPFHRHLGRGLLELLDFDGAVLELEQAYALDPGSIEGRTELAKAYTDVRRFADAARVLESVWQEKPALEIAKGLGLTYLELEDYTRARQLLEFVHAQSPGEVEVERALERMRRQGR